MHLYTHLNCYFLFKRIYYKFPIGIVRLSLSGDLTVTAVATASEASTPVANHHRCHTCMHQAWIFHSCSCHISFLMF